MQLSKYLSGTISRKRKKTRIIALFLLATLIIFGGSSQVFARGNEANAVYVMNNNADDNAVLVFERANDGTLAEAGSFSTGGLGSGGGLGSQGALVLSDNGRWLFAVNAGSDEVSVFAVDGTSLHLTHTIASGGDQPISLTAHGNLLYVLNAGSGGNITGFYLGRNGRLILPQNCYTHIFTLTAHRPQ